MPTRAGASGSSPPPATKVVVTHLGALRAKHGAAGLAQVRAALTALTTADAARGVRTRLVAVDDGRTARALKAVDVDDPTDAAAVKRFVDAVAARWAPDYLLLLGSPDVVAMQTLTNPLWTGDPRRGDPDRTVPSDLPYACEAGPSADPGRFRGATRVVGRLPDGTGADDPAQLLRLLDVATRYRSRGRGDYLPPFAVSAAEWHLSTSLTLTQLVGDAAALADSPPSGPSWTPDETRRRLHLVNLHGGPVDPRYFGQQGRSYPVAQEAATLAAGRRLLEGTVGAAECCYGGMLYDPAEAGDVAGFADTYLAAGAYGYCASTTTSYGPSDSNDAADVVCRLFLQHVLAGASLGRALLQARQDYVFTRASLSPVDLKTLAQFTLFGDPSVHPVRRPATGPTATAVTATAAAGPSAGLAARRRRLRANGSALESSTTRAAASPDDPGRAERVRLTAALAVRLPRTPAAAAAVGQLRSYPVVAAPSAAAGPGERFLVLQERRPSGLHVVVAREEAGRVLPATLLRER